MQSGIFFFKSPRWAAHLYSGPLRIGVQFPLEIVLHQLTQRLVHRLLVPTSRGIGGLSQRRSWRWRRCCCQSGEKQDQTCTKSRHHCSSDLPRRGMYDVFLKSVSVWPTSLEFRNLIVEELCRESRQWDVSNVSLVSIAKGFLLGFGDDNPFLIHFLGMRTQRVE